MGKPEIEKELDIVRLLITIRNLKEFVKNSDNGATWRSVKKQAKYLSKYTLNIDETSSKIEATKRKQSTI